MPKHLLMLLLTVALAQPPLALAADLQPFTLNYKASYGSFDAAAVRSLSPQPASNSWEMRSKVEVKLLGSTLVSVEESSTFNWKNELAVPSKYEYVQKGLNKRQRKLEFAANGQSASYTINDKSGVLTLMPPVFDNLTSGLMLRKHVLNGETDINLTVADKEEVSPQSYQVVGTETTVIPAGTFNTVHIKRIRDSDSKRTTDIWLAPDHDYVMVKLLQTEPDGNTISLQLKSGTIGGQSF